jgi:hypothetical protein
MPTNKEIENEHRNKKIIADYEKALSKAPVNKTKFAEEHGTSLRTLNRVLDEVGLKQAKYTGETSAKKPVVVGSKTVKAKAEPKVKKPAKVAKKVVLVRLTPEPEVLEEVEVIVDDEGNKLATKVVEKVEVKIEDDQRIAKAKKYLENAKKVVQVAKAVTDSAEEFEKEADAEALEEVESQGTFALPYGQSENASEEVGETASQTKAVVTETEIKVASGAVNNEIISWNVDKTRFISVLLSDGNTLSVEKDHENYQEIIHNLAIGEYKDALNKMSIVHKLANLEFGNFVVSVTGITFNGKPIKNAIVDDLLLMFGRKEPMEHLLKFFENLMMTPSEHIYTHLWKLIKHAGVTITSEGNVECFKRVNADFTDCYTNKILNRVGDTVIMRRSEVNDDPNQTCSAGLHVCALQYLNTSGYGGGGVIVKVVVRPQDFVSIPSDYKFTKARTCRYKVVSVYKN